MPAFAFLLLTCQLRQEGEGGCLIQATRSSTNDPRGLACLFGDGVTRDEQQHNDS